MTVQPTRDQLRALANAATEGPWNPHPAGKYVWTEDLGGIIQNWSDDANAVADMEFIAAARTAVPALLDMLGQVEQRIRDLTQDVRDERAACLDQMEQVQIRDARIKAVEALCDAAEDPDQWPPRPAIHGGETFPASLMVDDIRSALDG